MDCLRSGVQDQPGQHGENPSLLEIQKKKSYFGCSSNSGYIIKIIESWDFLAGHGGSCLALWEAEAGGLLEARSS